MAQKTRLRAPTAIVTRQGEGFNVDVDRHQVMGLDGRASTRLGFNIRTAPVPDRRYVADLCGVMLAKGWCQLLFGQKRIGRQELRSLVVIHMTTMHASQFLESVLEMKDPSLEEIVKLNGLAVEPPEPVLEEPEQTVALNSNVAGVAVAGEETCLDFYQISAASVHAANLGSRLQVNPVVRVELLTARFVGLIDELQKTPAPQL